MKPHYPRILEHILSYKQGHPPTKPGTTNHQTRKGMSAKCLKAPELSYSGSEFSCVYSFITLLPILIISHNPSLSLFILVLELSQTWAVKPFLGDLDMLASFLEHILTLWHACGHTHTHIHTRHFRSLTNFFHWA